MTTLGKIDEFIPATGDWTKYIERMNLFLLPTGFAKSQE